jgi:hypothetical protein
MDNVADSFEVLTERKIKENENKREPDKGGIWIGGCGWRAAGGRRVWPRPTRRR